MNEATETLRRRINLSIAGLLVISGAVAALWLVRTKPLPAHESAHARVPHVEVLRVEPGVFDPPIVGYGTIRPKRQVKIIPEVSGRLVRVHADLAPGNIILEGELLFEIDPQTYESRLKQAEAEVQRLETQLERHVMQKRHLEDSLVLAERREALARTREARERSLVDQESGTAPELEAAEDARLRYQEAVLVCRSELAMLPLQVQETQALLATRRAQVDEAKLALERTKILCPFDARVDEVRAQAEQVVVASLQIASLTDMEALELSVVVDPRELRWTDQDAFASAVGEDREAAPAARITWTLLGRSFSWTARVTRLERMDEATRTAHVVVEIRDIMQSMEVAKGRSRPPLSVGMFCRAELPTEPLQDALVVPRHAIYEGRFVYVYEPDAADPAQGRLAVRQVPLLRAVADQVLVAFRRDGAESGDAGRGEEASVACELRPGDQVVLSPLPKAVDGMRLRLRASQEAVAWHVVPYASTTVGAGAVTGVQ